MLLLLFGMNMGATINCLFKVGDVIMPALASGTPLQHDYKYNTD
jgi:hypothetical protein